MTPRTMALAFFICRDCRQHGWERTVAEIADSLGEDEARVRRVAQLKGWLSRMRAATDPDRGITAAVEVNGQVDGLAGARRYGAEELVA